MRILISAIVAMATTYGMYAWQARQLYAEGAPRPPRGRILWPLALMYGGWAAPMTLLVWVGFLDPVRSLAAYPFARLGLSLLVGVGVVAVGSIAMVLLRYVAVEKPPARLPLWRLLNPMGCQLLFIMFSGLAFQHSGWGGPP